MVAIICQGQIWFECLLASSASVTCGTLVVRHGKNITRVGYPFCFDIKAPAGYLEQSSSTHRIESFLGLHRQPGSGRFVGSVIRFCSKSGERIAPVQVFSGSYVLWQVDKTKK